MTIEERKNILGKIFSPTAPIKEKDFFYGRIDQINQIVEAINQIGQHGIIYGERGVGKTSLANIISKSITNLHPAKITCNKQDTFKTIWVRALNKIQYSTTTQGIGFVPEVQSKIVTLADNISGKDKITISDIEGVISNFPSVTFLFVFDEFDNITKNIIRSEMSDLIKSLSDNLHNITVVIVGIADNVENLIGNHQSLERCLMQVQMPRMSEDELKGIIRNGISKLEMEIKKEVTSKIVSFSSGFPHYTHLLAKYSAQNALNRNSTDIKYEDLEKAIIQSVQNTNEQLRTSFRNAIMSSSVESQWKDVLYACAIADNDEFNCFSTNDILTKFNIITGKNSKRENIKYNLAKFCKEERGNILEKIGEGRNFKYKFTNPMMKPFIKLNMNDDK